MAHADALGLPAQAAMAGLGAVGGGLVGHHASKALLGKRKQKRASAAPLPPGSASAMLTAAEPAKSLGRKVWEQVPGFNWRDYLLGGTAGGLAGLGVNALRSSQGLTPRQARRRKWTSILAGAGIGGLTTNVAMDRARRYLSNTASLYGYGDGGQKEIKPTWKKVWQQGILDKPFSAGRPATTQHGMGRHAPRAPAPLPGRAHAQPRARSVRAARRRLLQSALQGRPVLGLDHGLADRHRE